MLFFAGIAQIGLAQEVQVNESPEVSRVMRSWISANRADPSVAGWRVQIMASTNRILVDEGRTRFRSEYPYVSASSVQEQPYYKLRVGAFRTKQEALTFISTLSGWPGAYPAMDAKIHPRDFLEQ